MAHNPFSRHQTTVFGAPQNSTTPSLFGQKPTTTFGTSNAFSTNNAFGTPPASTTPFGNATTTTKPFGSSTTAFAGTAIKAFPSTTPFGGATTTTKHATTTTPFGGATTTQPFAFQTTPFATTTTAKPPTATTTPTPPTFAFTTPAAPTPTSFTFNSGPSSTTTTPALPTTTTPELIIDAVTATTPDQSELSERQMQAPMFRGAVLRDLYAFLLNPNAPGRPLPTPSPTTSASSRFGAALLGKSSNKLDMTSAIDTLAFVDRAAVATATSLPAGWRVLDEPTLLSALDHMGEVSALPLAAMKAFEKYLARKVATWTEDEAKSLSVQFLVCFGLELTPRLDVHHRIRSTKLTDEEMAVLTSPPYSHFVDQALLERYQKASNPTTNPATNNSSTSNLLALPAPSIPMPAAHEQPPASPRAFSFALPDPPAAQAQATSTPSAHAQLFKKV